MIDVKSKCEKCGNETKQLFEMEEDKTLIVCKNCYKFKNIKIYAKEVKNAKNSRYSGTW